MIISNGYRLSIFLCCVIPFCIYNIHRVARLKSKVGWTCFTAIIMYYTLLSGQRLVALSLVIMIAWFLIELFLQARKTKLPSFSKNSKNIVIVCAMCIVFALSTIYLTNPHFFNIDSRIATWQRALTLFSKSPMFGFGFGSFSAVTKQQFLQGNLTGTSESFYLQTLA